MNIVVGGIIEKDGKYLLIQEAKKMCYGKWNFPAGRLEFKESLKQGAIREIKEETGCDVELNGVCYIANRILEDDLRIMVFFNAKLVNENIKYDKNEILDVKWIGYDEIMNKMDDESYILENKENVLLVEFPAFYDNLEEFEKYVKELNKNIVGKVFSDHPNGGTILKDVKGYASEGTKKSMKEGTIHNLVTGFEKSFNGAFAKEFHKITDVLKDEKANIGGFELKITYHEENIEIEFPQIGCVYTHMLGHDCHSIVAGEGHANVIIAQLKRYKENGYNLVLSSHYTPETLKDVDTKIAYL